MLPVEPPPSGPNPTPLAATAVSAGACSIPDPCLFAPPEPPADSDITPVPCVTEAVECETRLTIVSKPSPPPGQHRHPEPPVSEQDAPLPTAPEPTVETAAPPPEPPPEPPPPTGTHTPASNRELGRALAAERGWTGGEWECLDVLWGQKESGWSHTAANPNSSAYGIPQSLPGSKMASHGSDWRTNPATQIAWGLDYVAGRYGSPCGGLSFHRANDWY